MDFKEDEHREVVKDIRVNPKKSIISSASDCNSNNITMAKENVFLCSTDSIHDCPDFLQDNSDYQWFLDYGYKDNNYSHHQSILSLSRSQDLDYYENMARNIDANLAEVDMDEFNREDIHSVLSTLPNMQEEREMFASVSKSMMVKFDFSSPISPNSNSEEEQINCASICKSQLLFSPVRESYLPNTNLSVDSLDLSENDINLMVTCQANKNNYTIAFEGSTVMASDDSESRETDVLGASSESAHIENEINVCNNEVTKKQKASQCNQSGYIMARSDSTFTTWSKIKENSSENLQLRRHPSGNNNTNLDANDCSSNINSSGTVKSQSLPNLFRQKHRQNSGMSLSFKLNKTSDNSESDKRQQCIKLYDIQNSCNSKSVDQSNSNFSGNPPQKFSLVKLFIKQKSSSHEGMSNYVSHQGSDCNKCGNDCQQCHKVEQLEDDITKSNKVINKNKLNKNMCSLTGCETLNIQTEVKNEQNNISKINDPELVQKCSHNSLGGKNDLFENTERKSKNSHECLIDKYYSDESTQENGSNTESAENLTCNCNNPPPSEKKKFVLEKSIQTSKVFDHTEKVVKNQKKVPAYILYPNYSLPNLEFLKKEHYVQNIDFSKVFLRPQKFKMPELPMRSSKSGRINAKRPFSVNDIETLKKTGFKHVKDWESLTFLLPTEYKQFLQEIPEIVAQLKDVKSTKKEVVPLFCLSPTPSRSVKKRPTSCDINFFSNDCRNSNFSSTATQPSSGYRGSSTMLNSNYSNAPNSPKVYSVGYKYDSSSESSSSRRSGSVPHSKNYVNTEISNDIPPPRPPLPRSILRNNSLDNQHYTCKTQKENANKRYSMIEISDKNSENEEKLNRRRSVQGYKSKSPQKSINRNLEQDQFIVDQDVCSDKMSKVSHSSESESNYCVDGRSNLASDMRRLEELLEISSIFSENIKSFTESDMVKLRSQVSKFLTMQKNLEKVSETLQTVEEATANDFSSALEYEGCNSLEIKHLHTPHNTPEHKKQSKMVLENERNRDLLGYQTKRYLRPCDCIGQTHEFEDESCKFREENGSGMKKTVSFAEKITFAVKEHESKSKEKTPPNSPNVLVSNQKLIPGKSKRPVDLPICEESLDGTGIQSPVRNTLGDSAELTYKRDLILDVRNAVEKILTVVNEKNNVANICLHHLCPSLYAILNDGLKEEIDTPFGPIRNSVWSVIEASSQQGPMTQTLNELVQRLNRDDIFSEGLIKFNAFIFGLLNSKAVSGWFSYLRTRDTLLRKYYGNNGLLLMSNTAGAPVRALVDNLITILESLCSVQFNLDLLYQTKQLHCSLQNLNFLLEESGNNDFLTPTKQFMLLKLVQSIQNSISQSEENKRSKHIIEDVEKKTSDPPLSHLLEKNKIRNRKGVNKARPRSGCDSLGEAQGITDIAGAMKKRWSGVHLNSKLVEAFDRLGDESESDYTDSLDNCKPRMRKEETSPVINGAKKVRDGNLRTREIEADFDTKEQKKNILLNLNKQSLGKSENCKTELIGKESGEGVAHQIQNGGRKFRRLQQKWEKLSGRSASDSDSEIKSPPTEGVHSCKEKNVSKWKTSGKSNCDNTVTTPSPTSKISKIPRLVTSPLSSGPTTKQTENIKKLVSPTSVAHPNSHHKIVKTSSQGSVKSNVEIKPTSASGSRLSRCAEKADVATAPGKAVTRPTSLPYRGCNTMPAKKNEVAYKRASSMSLNRKPVPKKLQHVPRTVRTLTHRLPSDSGHLSFNEGEKLKVVLEVDKTWLLCCRGDQKGLVPKSAVISDIEDNKF